VDDLGASCRANYSLSSLQPDGPLGAPCYKGAELAVEKLNAAGGVLGRRIELISIDTASEVSRTTNELESGAALRLSKTTSANGNPLLPQFA
jgi:Periplasmic binding protein